MRASASIAVATILAGCTFSACGERDQTSPRAMPQPQVRVAERTDACEVGPEPSLPDDRWPRHVLNRVGYGPRPGDIAKLQQIGVVTYLDQQLAPGAIADDALEARLVAFETQRMSTAELVETYYMPALIARRTDQFRPSVSPEEPDPTGVQRRARLAYEELRQQKLLRAIMSERQLQEVLVDFWFNHFNVAASKGLAWLYLPEYERDAIRPHVLGRFRDLLGAVARSPAMVFYLDNWLSSDPDGPDPFIVMDERAMGPASRVIRRWLDRLRPRSTAVTDRLRRAMNDRQRTPGLNENYARELLELHTLGVDGGYTQADVVEVARAFTGWTIDDPWGRGGGFVFEARIHVAGEKTVLDTVIGDGGMEEGLAILDILASHPSTARLVATKLARRFVADDPPASVVDRAAACFLASGGDIRDVVRTILRSSEFFDPDTFGGKAKTPFEFAASAVRAVDADIEDVTPLLWALDALGMRLYGYDPPTGYPDRAEAWINAGALLARMDFAVALASNQFDGVGVDVGGRASAATPAQVALRFGDSAFQRR